MHDHVQALDGKMCGMCQSFVPADGLAGSGMRADATWGHIRTRTLHSALSELLSAELLNGAPPSFLLEPFVLSCFSAAATPTNRMPGA